MKEGILMRIYGWWMGCRGEMRIISVGGVIFLLDQLTKLVIVLSLRLNDHWAALPGFLHIVHWGNTGSAWSLFHGRNHALAVVALVAVAALWYWRHHFEAHRMPGQVALGLLFGGTVGNLLDRLLPGRRHVVDFLYFHVQPRGSTEVLGFPAFNVADMAICVGVGILMLLSFHSKPPETDESAGAGTGSGTGSVGGKP